MVFVFILLSLAALLLMVLLWGIGSYAAFILLMGSDRQWHGAGWTSALLFVGFAHVGNAVRDAGGMAFTDQGVSDFAEPATLGLNLFAALVNLALALGGFAVGRRIVKDVARTLQNADNDETADPAGPASDATH